jgi:exopolysaccharide transport family protein
MLRNQKPSPLLDAPQYEQGFERSGPGMLNLAVGFLRRHYLVIAIAAALSVSVSIVFLRVVPPTYTAQVKILLGSSKAPSVQTQATLDDAPIDLDSQIEILKSKAIATAVINQLNLANDPEFNGKGSPLHDAMDTIRRMAGMAPQEAKLPSMDELVDGFLLRISAFRVTNAVIEVDFSASDAKRAAVIANAIVKNYFDDQLKAKTDEHHTVTAWLHDRLQELGNDALNAERAVNELKAKSNIVSAGGKFQDEEQVSALNNRLVAARAHTAEAMARVNRFDAILASNDIQSVPLTGLDAVPDRATNALGSGLNAPEGVTLASPNNTQILNSLRQQYLEYARREYEFSAKLGPDHMVVVNLHATMKSIRQTILDEVHRLADIAKGDFEESKQQQREVEQQLAQAVSRSRNTSSAELSIRELETSAKGYRALYESFLQRYMGTVQQGSFPITEARVISPASPPQKKSKPKTTLVLPIGLLGGIAFGVALGLLGELRDRGFRTSSQIEDRLHLPCLSVVPLLRRRKVNELTKNAAALIAAQADTRSDQRMVSRGSGTCWAASAMPSSRFAESIRSIRTALDLSPNMAPSRVVGLTSTLPNEGKSTIAASLAQLVAGSGKRVIVVDCDLRNPSLSANLAPYAAVGIADVISGERALEDAVWTDSVTGLDFLPGKGVPRANLDTFSSEQTKKLFDQLRKTYDYVIVDLPPLAPVVDARVISALLDSVVLVVEWGRTTADVIEHALSAAPNVYDTLLGVVLNKTDMRAMKAYANHFGDYYNQEHYTRYGQLTAE